MQEHVGSIGDGHASYADGKAKSNGRLHMNNGAHDPFNDTVDPAIHAEDASENYEPLFSVNKVQFTLTAPLAHLCASNNLLVLILDSSLRHDNAVSIDGKQEQTGQRTVTVTRIDLDNAEVTEECLVSIGPDLHTTGRSEEVIGLIRRAFLDPTGRHLLLCDWDDRLYYLHGSWKTARQLQKTKGPLNVVSWNKAAVRLYVEQSINQTSHEVMLPTGEILFGMDNGRLHSLILDPNSKKGKEEVHARVLHTIIDGKGPESILGCLAENFPTEPQKWLILVLTPFRLLQFVGNVEEPARNAMFEQVFQDSLRRAQPSSQEIPLLNAQSRLLSLDPYRSLKLYAESKVQRFVVQCQSAAFMAQLSWANQEAGDSVVGDGQMLAFPETTDNAAPFTISVLEYHILLGFRDQSVKALCILDNAYKFWAALPTALRSSQSSSMIEMVKDPIFQTVWAWTDREIFEISVGNENTHVWNVFKDLGRWTEAQRTAPSEMARDTVRRAQGHSYLKAGNYNLAARAFSGSTEPFEQVILQLMQATSSDALRLYIKGRLNRLPKKLRAQRTMMSFWLVELCLEKLAALEDHLAGARVASELDLTGDQSMDEGASLSKLDLTDLESELRGLLTDYKSELDPESVFQLLSEHGRKTVELFYASLLEDRERIFDLHMGERKWQEALLVLAETNDHQKIYHSASTLMREAPKAFVDFLISSEDLDYSKLVTAFLQDDQHLLDESIRYHEHLVINESIKSSVVHNVLIGLYVQKQNVSAILSYLQSTDISVECDLEYALRLCRRQGMDRAVIELCGALKLYSLAVEYALDSQEISLAQEYADKVEDPLQKKRVWLDIARQAMSSQGDRLGALQTLQQTDCLDIVDILPFFPDLTRINTLKAEVVQALEHSEERMIHTRKQIKENDNLSIALKEEEQSLKSRRLLLQQGERCSICYKAVATRALLLFPCQHAFHENCLISKCKSMMHPTEQKRFTTLQTAIIQFYEQHPGLTGSGDQLSGYAADLANTESREDNTADLKLGAMLQQFHDLLECTLCGEASIVALDQLLGKGPNIEDWLV